MSIPYSEDKCIDALLEGLPDKETAYSDKWSGLSGAVSIDGEQSLDWVSRRVVTSFVLSVTLFFCPIGHKFPPFCHFTQELP